MRETLPCFRFQIKQSPSEPTSSSGWRVAARGTGAETSEFLAQTKVISLGALHSNTEDVGIPRPRRMPFQT
jgi:hypothetical protein